MKKKIIFNSSSAILLQIVTLISGLIVPKIMISAYGSEVNGLIGSITQFIAYISLVEAGLGGVIRVALYRPLVEKNSQKVSLILSEGKRYFNRISLIFVIYILLMMIAYPMLVNTSLSSIYISSLILIISVSTFSQYYIGIVYSILLHADSKLYLNNIIQIFSVICNTILVVIFVNCNYNIHLVRLISSSIYTIKPILLMFYVRKHYQIVPTLKPEIDVLPQKFNALAHHIAWYLHNNTDIVILSFLGNLKQVSIYMVYNMIVTGLVGLITSLLGSMESIFGIKLITNSLKQLQDDFNFYIFVVMNVVFIMFYVAFSTLIPFIKLYTHLFLDANYILPFFGYALLFSQMLYCIRIPYYSIATASGRFRETQNSAIIETTLNLVISVLLVKNFGLLGVVFGTIIAILYRTLFYIYYLSNNIVHIDLFLHLRRLVVILLFMLVSVYFSINYLSSYYIVTNYSHWCLLSFINFIIGVFIVLILDFLIYRDEITIILQKIKGLLCQ